MVRACAVVVAGMSLLLAGCSHHEVVVTRRPAPPRIAPTPVPPGGVDKEDAEFVATHRTLPMGSLLKVTNEKTGQSAILRVTDRGPFVKGRSIDLSIASAKATGVYRMGLATVRIDVYKTPKPMGIGGRWCVQIGAFEHEGKARSLERQLERKYPDAQVIDFAGDTGYWVRIRPAGDSREVAQEIARSLKPAEGDAYLTRLD